MGFFRRKEKKILVFGPQKGRFEILMKETLRGIEVAREVFGNKRNVEIVFKRTDLSIDKTYSQLSYLLSRSKYDVVISPLFSTYVPAISAVVEKFKVPLLLTVASVPFISKISKYSVSLVYTDEDQAKAIVDFSKRYYYVDHLTLIFHLKYKELSFMAEAIRSRAQEENINITQIFKRQEKEISFDPIETDWISKSDMVIALGAEEIAMNINKIVSRSGNRVKILSNDYLSGCNDEKLRELDGVVHTTAYFPKGGLKGIPKAFLDTYKKKYGNTPNFRAALAFDAYSVVLHALNNYDGRGELINKIKSGTRYPGSFGEFIIEKSGKTRRKVLFVRIENGKRIYEGGIECE